MPADGEQLALPVHATFPEPAPPPGSQRWTRRRHCWVPASEGGFRAADYTVAPIDELTARMYVVEHHYSGSYPVARRRYGLFYREPTGPVLVGVAVFGVPMSPKVLSNLFPELPASCGVELSRFVLEGPALQPGKPGGRAPGNAESWFLKRCLTLLAEDGILGVVAFSDPVPRHVPGSLLWPGHFGRIYQASNAIYTGRGTARHLTVLPDGTTVTDRVLSKIRNNETGRDYAVRRLVDLGASPYVGRDPAVWIRGALKEIGAVRVAHPGNHRYAFLTSRSARRNVRVAVVAQPYPKAPDPRVR